MEAVLDCHTWDLVLGDYNMPHYSGTAALQRLREHGLGRVSSVTLAKALPGTAT